ncbi:polyphosphate kinase 2 family protein [Rhodoplanes sp. TEM]|uniref:Polyphosphate kinase 2 family protein n=1 Tax=Rhodoplanes tepidamans TaxID=200616 RepID=A0ABT5JB42_RHOTP|nr:MULTISPECIES: polyphosphate kinase 2 family protein [Rhodoplanes]MDC7786901.1 polyphosphate kinase 2 family protein [Rhodoplanes tepidamans]MDC7985367.1 polyphosphate kinase 2 family protein [Rhodoplanes sp. TEM]MDQ0355403.1 PPK2 family polyphosphate:nucleotide phosphotransferase [Rhodoplanes tepidamans]
MPMKAAELIAPYRITKGRKFKLSSIAPDDTSGLDIEKEEAKLHIAAGVTRLSEMQEKLYAQDRWSVLLIFQAMDAAGKDGAIKHVMSGVNPQGCQVTSFKQPSALELDHDYLWRCALHLPERGRIGIFNRSYYEEVLVARVHESVLARQKLPPSLVTKSIFEERYEDIAAHERYLARNGTLILKFFLHVSKREQKRRFLERLDEAEKNWKFSGADLAERAHWKEYMRAYEDMIRATAAEHAPWFVVPSDNKWFARLVIVAAVVEAMDSLDLAFPTLSKSERAALLKARAALARENHDG